MWVSCPPEIDPRPGLTGRRREIVVAARSLLEEDGWEAVTMRAIATRLEIKAPSLYKHFPGKPALGGALTAWGLVEMGEALHTAAASGGGVPALLSAYRTWVHGSPHLYRLATTGRLSREGLPPGLEDWAGTPLFDVTGDPYVAQALWATAHGLSILEIDNRYPTGAAPKETWDRAAEAFA